MDHLVREYMVHCYLYYKKDSSIIPDADFDKLCKKLADNWDEVKMTSYRKYISHEDLAAGTGYSIKNYPRDIVEEAETRLATWQAQQVMHYRTMTDDPEELYNSLKDSPSWFLAGLFVDYNHFLRGHREKQKMAMRVIERILEERKND